ncbi:MAG TPA: S8 family peptidase, partial [Albitalea sp.]|nr:S8 family peptidase [Albitalea sp.]
MTLHRIALGLGLVALAFSAGAQQAARQTYIVQLADAPVASYAGTLPGYAATKPAAGAKLDVNASNVRAYIHYLDVQRSNALAQVAGANIVHRYSVAFNGFAAKLTPAEVKLLKTTAGVVAVTPDEARPMDTTRTPAFLGLTAPGGLWSMLDASARNVKGEDVIIGMVDGGIWPENPSFSDKVDPSTLKPVPSFQAGTVVYGPPPAKWHGTCQAGQGFTTAMCNNKLIGAQFFNAGFTAFGRPLWPTDYVGPRDEDGHGSHTASTAGGNQGVDAIINGIPAGSMSGIAPRARLAAYRVCWSYVDAATNGRKNSCFTSDSIAAIDKAVSDGVDVINYSISGTQTNYLDPVEVAFLNATSAGVFVAASAGNSGPGNQVAHMSPWLTTVAASTHDRFTVASVTLGDASGSTFAGPSYQTTGVPMTDLILSSNAGSVPFASLSPADQTALSRCYNASDRASLGASALAALDPAKVAGKMVVCIRGGNVLINKADSVKGAGGVAMIIQNTPSTANTTILQPYVVPTVHLAASASSTVLAYAATAGAKASFGPGTQVSGVVAPVMADFSSRGPSLADLNILKPDISAPGVDIIAAYVADNAGQQAVHDAIVAGANGNPGTTSLQGTSMSSPHIAGTAALLKQLHPTWSPAMIKSALMTSTNDIKLANGSLDPNRFAYGAGHLNPNPAANPGLVYDAGTIDYFRFLCGVGSLPAGHPICVAYGAIFPWNLNLASITAADVLGKISITRTVTNVGDATATYVASSSLPGWTVAVVPPSLTLAPGASASYKVNLTRTSAAVGTWAFGNVTWTDGVHQVRSPLTVRGTLFSSPDLVQDTRATGTKVFTVGTGYDGSLSATATGLVPATLNGGSVSTNGTQCFNVSVPAGALLARFQLFNSDTQGGSGSDLDLAVFDGPDGSGTMVGSSGSSTSDEMVQLGMPAAATYSACVIGYAPLGGTATFTLSSWVVGPAVGPQTLKAVSSPKAYLGGTASVGL